MNWHEMNESHCVVRLTFQELADLEYTLALGVAREKEAAAELSERDATVQAALVRADRAARLSEMAATVDVILAYMGGDDPDGVPVPV